MDATATIIGVVDTEAPFVTVGIHKRSTPVKTRFGNAELIAYLVKAKVLSGAFGWILKCEYDSRFVYLATGAFSFVAVNAAGERVALDDFIRLEPLAQVLNGRLRLTSNANGAFGGIAETRFYRLFVLLSDEDEAEAYGQIRNQLTIKRDGTEIIGVISDFKLTTSGHVDVDGLAAITLKVGQFRSVPAKN